MYAWPVLNAWSGCDLLASETAAARYLSQGRGLEDFAHRQARNKSRDQQGMFQRKDQIISE